MCTPAGWERADEIEYAPPPKVSGLAVASMILGIASLPLVCVLVGPVVGLVAAIMGEMARNRIKREPGRWAGEGHARTGCYTGAAAFLLGPVVICLLMPSTSGSHLPANRSLCSANITGILKAAIVYANDNNDVLPAVAAPAKPWTYSTEVGVNSGLTDADKAIAAAHGRVPGNPVAGMWLLVERGQVSPKSFQCKSDPVSSSTPASAQDSSGNWMLTPSKGDQISYSSAYPWAGGKDVGGWWRNTTDASVPLMADMAPLNGTGMPARVVTGDNPNHKVLNSVNHSGDGQNVGFGDAHAEWVRKPNVGQNDECIWTTGSTAAAPWGGNALSPGVIVPPVDPARPPYDIIMVPARDLNTWALR